MYEQVRKRVSFLFAARELGLLFELSRRFVPRAQVNWRLLHVTLVRLVRFFLRGVAQIRGVKSSVIVLLLVTKLI